MSISREMRVGTLAMALAISACGTDAAGTTTPGDQSTPPGSTNSGNPPPTGLRTATTHPMQYYVSLPKNWSASRTWPVVITIAGSGKEWPDNHAAFNADRDGNNYPFIIVTPLVVSNGGTSRTSPGYSYSSDTWDLIYREGVCPFDFDGIKAVAADVANLYHGQSKFFLTGFSGGNQTNAAILLLHPEWLRGSTSASGNYGGRCVTGFAENPLDDPVVHPVSTAPERVSLPIRIFNGTDDSYNQYLLPQRDSLISIARRSGYTNINFGMVNGTGHSPMPPQVLAAFYALLAANEK